LGMGIEFTQITDQQREQVEKFIQVLTSRSNGVLPDLLVEPEGLDSADAVSEAKIVGAAPDPLLELFQKQGNLAPEAFQVELRNQRRSIPKAAAQNASV